MLTTIRRNTHTDETAVDLPLACHQRIRQFTEIATRIAGALEAPEADVADAAKRVNRYFSIALPLHMQDEEESLRPRLAGADAPVLEALATMEREHRDHEETVAKLLALTKELSTSPGSLARLSPELAETTSRLEALFATHLAREESVIFPAVLRAFDAATHAAVQAEYRERRQWNGVVGAS